MHYTRPMKTNNCTTLVPVINGKGVLLDTVACGTVFRYRMRLCATCKAIMEANEDAYADGLIDAIAGDPATIVEANDDVYNAAYMLGHRLGNIRDDEWQKSLS
jgi:hypothetical protein